MIGLGFGECCGGCGPQAEEGGSAGNVRGNVCWCRKGLPIKRSCVSVSGLMGHNKGKDNKKKTQKRAAKAERIKAVKDAAKKA